MTKRYYYDCPLEAAYMVKSFNMLFCGPKGEGLYHDGSGSFRRNKDSTIYRGEKLYVDDSNTLRGSILHPLLGDVIETPFTEDKPIRYQEIVLTEYRDLLVEHGGYRIIQRDGKAFIWPKEVNQ